MRYLDTWVDNSKGLVPQIKYPQKEVQSFHQVPPITVSCDVTRRPLPTGGDKDTTAAQQ